VPVLTQVVVPLFSGTHPDGQQTSALALWISPNTNTFRRTANAAFLARLVIALGLKLILCGNYLIEAQL
jgi:hypothetical protein